MTDFDHAWAAGFFDGEGCVMIMKNTKNHYLLCIEVGQMDPKPLRKFEKLYGGNIRIRESRWDPTKSFYVWAARTEIAREALEAMLPYLVLKKGQAKVALRFQEIHMSTRYKHNTPQGPREQLYRQLQGMKRV